MNDFLKLSDLELAKLINEQQTLMFVVRDRVKALQLELDRRLSSIQAKSKEEKIEAKTI